MKRLTALFFFLAPSLAMAQSPPDPQLQVPATLVQKLWKSAGADRYDTVRPLEDELNRALHPPASTPPLGAKPAEPQGPVIAPPPAAEEHHDDAK